MSGNWTEELQQLKNNVDDVFLLTNAIIISMMQCGFACLEAGSVRSKNVTNIIMKNLMDIFVCAVVYWLIGYSLAYGTGNLFMGASNWAGHGLPPSSLAHWFFQFIFAATAATIVSGAVAERCHYVAYLVYSSVISGFIYPVVTHWTWSEEGWLNTLGFHDFAGSGAVHLLAGTCSLVAAIFIGPRIGRFQEVKRSHFEMSHELVGHSVPLVGIGGLILIMGFLAFNGGSLGHMSHPGDGGIIAKVMVNTVLGGTGASFLVLVASRMGLTGTEKAWGFANTLNGALTGMVTVCASADGLTFWSSFVSGLIAGIVYLLLHAAVIYMKVDDPLDTVGVHFGGGLWGLIAGALFGNEGIVYGINETSSLGLLYNIAGAAAIILWAGILSAIMFGILNKTGFLRVSAEQEMSGLDYALHKEHGYPQFGWQPAPGSPCVTNSDGKNHISTELNSSGMKDKHPDVFKIQSEFHNRAFENTEASML